MLDEQRAKVDAQVENCYGRFTFLPKFMSEFMGTFFLGWIFAFASTKVAGSFSISVIVGAAYFALLVASGQMSKGFFNPIITINETLMRHIHPADALIYLIAQFGGGFLGALLAFGFRNKDHFNMAGAHHPKGYDLGIAFSLEMLTIAFLLVFFSMSRSTGNIYATDERSSYIMFSLINFALMASVTPLTGGMLNPAVDTFNNLLGFGSQDDYTSLDDDEKEAYNDSLVIYLLAPLISIVIAFILSAVIYDPSLKATDTRSKTTEPTTTTDVRTVEKPDATESKNEELNNTDQDIKEESLGDRN